MVYKTVRCWLDRPSQTLLTQEIQDMLAVVERAKEGSKQPLTVFFQRDLETLKQFARDGESGFEWHGPEEQAEIIANLLELIPGVTANII
jgi:hypothetical protein